MARIPLIQRKDEMAQETHTIYDKITRSRGAVGGPFSLLLHSPQVADRASHLGTYIRFESKLSAKERELVIITVAREMRCQFEWAYHVVLARAADIPEEAIGAIRNGHLPAGLSKDELHIVSYVEQLLRANRVQDGVFQAVREHMGVQGLVDLTATVGYYAMLACVLNAFELVPPSGQDPFPLLNIGR